MSLRRAGEGFRLFEPIERVFVTVGCRKALAVSCLYIVVDRDDGEASRCRHLLAVYEMRRDLERPAVDELALWRPPMAMMTSRLVRHLLELIAALDRRPPRPERAAEAAIARDAAALRASAVKRIAELEHETTSAPAQ
jgi:hypothetical protein